MEPTKRILINTTVQYLRTAINMLLTLYSTRIVLSTLGEDDFGIYSLIGSLVMMMSFITSSLAASTQRFLSYSWGKNDINEVKAVFCNSMVLHIGISLLIVLVMIAAERPIVHDYLCIATERLGAADFVYYMVLIILTFSFITAPIRALFIARENIVYVSIIEIIDAVIKLGGALALSWIAWDSLKMYGAIMAFIALFTFAAYLVYALRYYDECIKPRLADISREKMRQMTGFALWTVYAVGSTVVRTQGLAIIINRFFGTMLNASYGIALQINNAISAIAMSIINAMNPQLMKAEGRGDRATMLKFSTLESKYSFLIIATVMIPVVVELPGILHFWLGKVPPSATEFSALMIIAFIIDQSTVGLTSANQAVGRIRNYSLLISTIKLMVLPLAWIALWLGHDATMVMVAYLAVETLCALIRIPFLKVNAGLDITDYCHSVYLRSALPVGVCIGISLLLSHMLDFPLRFLLTTTGAISLTLPLIYRFSLSKAEREWIKVRVASRLHRKDN